MEGRKFSSSRNVVIYVTDFLSRYDPDPLRYFLTAAGPETQDTDFTWAEFVRRNNDELVATWGNLVNRTLTNVHRNFGSVSEPGPLLEADGAVLAEVEAGFETVGDLLEHTRFKAALAEAMRLAAAVDASLSDQAAWSVIKPDRAGAATILLVAVRAVDGLKVIMAPFLPFSSQRLHEMLGYDDEIAGMPRVEERTEAGGLRHSVLTGDYSGWVGKWKPSEIEAGRPLREPEPLFKKLDPSIVDEELSRMAEA